MNDRLTVIGLVFGCAWFFEIDARIVACIWLAMIWFKVSSVLDELQRP